MLNNDNPDILELANQKAKEEMGKRITVSDLYSDWIQFRMATKNPSTVKKDIWVWNTYYEGSDISKEILRNLRPPVITTELLKMARQRGLTQRKFREMKSVLNKILDYAVDMGYIFSNPSRQIHGISIDVFEEEEEKCKDDRIFSKESLETLKIKAREHYCKYDNMVYLAILMNLGLGLRVGELAALKIDDFDLKDDILTLRRSEQSTFKYEGNDICRTGSKIVGHLKKNRKDRHIPLSNYVVDIFIESLEYHQTHGIETDWLFVNKNGERLTTNSINQALNRISGKGNHTIRRTVITSLIRSGVFTQKEIMDIAGHKDYETTSKYYDYAIGQYTRERMDQALNCG